jgi:hypothetical protein
MVTVQLSLQNHDILYLSKANSHKRKGFNPLMTTTTYNIVINSPITSIHKRNLTFAAFQKLAKEYKGHDINVYPSSSSSAFLLVCTPQTVNIDILTACGKTARIATFDRPTNWVAIRAMTQTGIDVIMALLAPYMIKA